MDCFQSFQINITGANTFNNPAEVKTWGSGTNLHWSAFIQQDSIFKIQGFKNINLFEIEMTGQLLNDTITATSNCIVEDFGFYLILNGQMPIVSGQVEASPNFWNINPVQNEIAITKFQRRITLKNPIQSLQSIDFHTLFAEGNHADTANSVALRYNLTFVFKYKYEGE